MIEASVGIAERTPSVRASPMGLRTFEIDGAT
jgi:hypothetical protein